MSNRLQPTVIPAGIFFGTTLLVISIRGGFDPAPPPAHVSPQLAAALKWVPKPPQARFADFNLDEIGEMTPTKAFMLMSMGHTGPFSLPGVVQPPAEAADSAVIPDDAQIVGVEIDGHSRAYWLSRMSFPYRLVVNDVFAGVPVTVTFSDSGDLVRVFTQQTESHDPLDVGVGGYRDGQMLLHIGGSNFSQNSTEIPFDDLKFERMTWQEWKTAHPDTDVCTKFDPPVFKEKPSSTPAVLD